MTYLKNKINKTNQIRQTKTLIIGAGFAGLYLSQVLMDGNYDDFLVIAPNKKTVSDKSYYKIRSRGMRQDSLKKTILDVGQGKNNHQLVNVLVENIDDELTKLSLLTELQPSYVGVQVKRPQKFLAELKRKSAGKREIGEVLRIEKSRRFFKVDTTNGLILCKKIVFCTGGLRSKISSLFEDEAVLSDAFNLAKNIGCKTDCLNRIMYHPFYSGNKCLPSDDLFGFKIVDANGKGLPKTNRLIESHNAHFCFEEILKEMKNAGNYFAIKQKTKIKLNIAPHYRLGGIAINKNGQTNVKNVYALGECSFGLHGLGRVGGCALSEILVMARIISRKLIKE
ncbi:MAG: FAD-binding protein [Candidatus Paceibacterota bacterium]